MCLERPGVLHEFAFNGVRRIVVRLKPGAVGGVEGLDAELAVPVCSVCLVLRHQIFLRAASLGAEVPVSVRRQR